MSREVGWGQNSILLWQLKEQIRQASQSGAAVPTTTTTTTLP